MQTCRIDFVFAFFSALQNNRLIRVDPLSYIASITLCMIIDWFVEDMSISLKELVLVGI